jgi:hypothetical protein
MMPAVGGLAMARFVGIYPEKHQLSLKRNGFLHARRNSTSWLTPSIPLAVEMFAGRAHFRRAFRNLIQRTLGKATESTECPMERKMST